MQSNENLNKAKAAKNDEFYTRLQDIENELRHYRNHFKGKVVYCNCDDARESNFFKYFSTNFQKLGLKKLITSGLKDNGTGVVAIQKGDDIDIYDGNGDFRSEECIEFLKEADIVVTNPPFSLFREYVAQLMQYGKKFLIIGNMNAITYKEIFPYIKNNELWAGYGFNISYVYKTPYKNELEANAKFVKSKGCNPEDGYVKVPAVAWYTNLEHNKRNEELILYKHYNPTEYPKYDNYDAIEVSKVAEIPMDYEGVMGVPISFLDKYCPNQFEILGCADANIVPIDWKGMSAEFIKTYYAQGNTGSYKEGNRLASYIYNGIAKVPYKRILIQKIN